MGHVHVFFGAKKNVPTGCIGLVLVPNRIEAKSYGRVHIDSWPGKDNCSAHVTCIWYIAKSHRQPLGQPVVLVEALGLFRDKTTL